jgi:hypothetical protein
MPPGLWATQQEADDIAAAWDTNRDLAATGSSDQFAGHSISGELRSGTGIKGASERLAPWPATCVPRPDHFVADSYR